MIWLIGNRGMLGTEVENRLTTSGIDHVSTDHLECDITNFDAVISSAREFQPTCIVNCSAYTNVDQAEVDEKIALSVNALGVEHVAKAANAVGSGVIHVSTDYVFDGRARDPYVEETPMNPLGAYGRTKAEGERRLRAGTRRSTIIRTAWLYGPYGKNFVATMLRLFAERNGISVVSDQRGSPTYAADLANLICHVAEMMDSGRSDLFGTYHFTNSGETTWYDFAREIQRQSSSIGITDLKCEIRPISSDEYPTAAARPNYSVLSHKKLSGVFPEHIRPWQIALSDYFESIAGPEEQ